MKSICILLSTFLFFTHYSYAYQMTFETKCTIEMEREIALKSGVYLETIDSKKLPKTLIARAKGHITDGYVNSTRTSGFVLDTEDAHRIWSNVMIHNPNKIFSVKLDIKGESIPVNIDYDFTVPPNTTTTCNGTKIPHKVGISTPFFVQSYTDDAKWKQRSESFRNVALQLEADATDVSAIANLVENDLKNHSGFTYWTEPAFTINPIACLPAKDSINEFSTQMIDMRSADTANEDKTFSYRTTAWCYTVFTPI